MTTNPTAEWIARQITDAFPWNEAPDYLIRDRDAAYGHAVTKRLAAMGIRDHPTAARSPWQNGHAERLIGSIRRECLDHIVVFGEAHLRRILAAYAGYYNELPNTSVAGQGFAGPSADPTVRPACCSADPRRTSSSILSDLVCGRHSRAVAFLKAAVAHYKSLGVTVERVMTDNGSCYRSKLFAKACGSSSSSTSNQTLHPRNNGKAERFIQTTLREWAYARAYLNSTKRVQELPATTGIVSCQYWR